MSTGPETIVLGQGAFSLVCTVTPTRVQVLPTPGATTGGSLAFTLAASYIRAGNVVVVTGGSCGSLGGVGAVLVGTLILVPAGTGTTYTLLGELACVYARVT
jgi:hypothetical protein